MSTLIHIADRVLNRPLLIAPEKAQVILSVLAGRIGLNTPEASRFEGSPYSQDENGRPRVMPYKLSGGVAIITITGSLVNRGAWIGASSGLTSYEGIQHQLKAALADDKVQSVIIDMETPGGEAIGAFETAEFVRKLSAKKRTVALVNGMAASAGYAIASGATEIVTTETGVSGSIGVVMLHADYSKWLANEGIDPTLIFAGAHKVDGNPFQPLPDGVRADLQAEVMAFYDLFVRTVAKGRGERLNAAAARATEARTFIGKAAVDAGMADRLGTFESVLAELSRASGRSTPSNMRGKTMSDTNGAPAAETDAGIPQAEHGKAVNAALEKGKAEGATAERERITGVLSYLGRGHDAKVMEMAKDGKTTKAEAAVALMDLPAPAPAAGKTADEVLADMDKAAQGVESRPSVEGDGGNGGQAKATTPDGWKAEYEASDNLKAEYPSADAYIAYMKRETRKAA